MNTSTELNNFKTAFNISCNSEDISFQKLHVEPYDSHLQTHKFGEKKCLVYYIELTTFNINICLRILAFKYETYAEVLKLEIKINNENLAKEIAPCRNFLQRKRNINLTLEVLVKCAKLFEIRRLICLTVFQQEPNVVVMSNDGMIIKCYGEHFRTKYLEVNWTITWKVETYDISDLIEFYINSAVLEKSIYDKVKAQLQILIEPNIDFQSELKLWKSVMEILYGCGKIMHQERKLSIISNDVLEVSDSDDSVIALDCTLMTDKSNSEDIMILD